MIREKLKYHTKQTKAKERTVGLFTEKNMQIKSNTDPPTGEI